MEIRKKQGMVYKKKDPALAMSIHKGDEVSPEMKIIPKSKANSVSAPFSTYGIMYGAASKIIARNVVQAAERREKEWNHYASLFHCVCIPVNDLAIFLVRDAIDALQKTKYWRQTVKHFSKKAWQDAEVYEDLLMNASRHNDYGDRRQFLMDYMDSWQDGIQKDIIIFRECISSYLLKLGITEEMNQLQTLVYLAYIILDYSEELQKRFWEVCKHETGYDFSSSFRDFRLIAMLKAWYRVVCVFDPKNELNFDNDRNCVEAFKIIQYKCTGADLVNDAGMKALDMNEDVKECIRKLEKEEAHGN